MLRLATWPSGAATLRICVYGINTERKTKRNGKRKQTRIWYERNTRTDLAPDRVYSVPYI